MKSKILQTKSKLHVEISQLRMSAFYWNIYHLDVNSTTNTYYMYDYDGTQGNDVCCCTMGRIG